MALNGGKAASLDRICCKLLKIEPLLQSLQKSVGEHN